MRNYGAETTNGIGPVFGPTPKHSPPPEPAHVADPFDAATGRQEYRGVLDAVGDGLYSDDGGHPGGPRSTRRGGKSPSDARNDELLLNSRSSHAALRELYSRHRPALDEHGNPVDVDLEQRKAQIVRRWSQHVETIDTENLGHEEQRQPRSDVPSEQPRPRNDDSSVSPSRPKRSPSVTSPAFTGGASLATVSSVSSTSSARPDSASSTGSASVHTPTDQNPTPTRTGGHQHQGSEATVRPAVPEKTRRVMVGMSAYGVPIYREVRQDEPDPEPQLVGPNPTGKKDRAGATSGKGEGGGFGWLLSPQAKAEKAAAKVQAKMEKRAREAAERDAAVIRETERRKLREEMQDRLAKIRSGATGDSQTAKELARIDTYQFANAFVGNM